MFLRCGPRIASGNPSIVPAVTKHKATGKRKRFCSKHSSLKIELDKMIQKEWNKVLMLL